MTLDSLKSTRDAVPFRPFTLHMADGRALRVHHRDYLSISPGGFTIIVYKDHGGYSLVDLDLVNEVEVEPPVISPQSNGTGTSP